MVAEAIKAETGNQERGEPNPPTVARLQTAPARAANSSVAPISNSGQTIVILLLHPPTTRCAVGGEGGAPWVK